MRKTLTILLLLIASCLGGCTIFDKPEPKKDEISFNAPASNHEKNLAKAAETVAAGTYVMKKALPYKDEKWYDKFMENELSVLENMAGYPNQEFQTKADARLMAMKNSDIKPVEAERVYIDAKQDATTLRGEVISTSKNNTDDILRVEEAKRKQQRLDDAAKHAEARKDETNTFCKWLGGLLILAGTIVNAIIIWSTKKPSLFGIVLIVGGTFTIFLPQVVDIEWVRPALAIIGIIFCIGLGIDYFVDDKPKEKEPPTNK